MGLEPTIFRLEVERVIHCATRVIKYFLHAFVARFELAFNSP